MRIETLISSLFCLFAFSSSTSRANGSEVLKWALEYLPKHIVVHCDYRCERFMFDDPEGVSMCVCRCGNILVPEGKRFVFECNGSVSISVCELMALLYRDYVATKILLVGLSQFNSYLRCAILEKFIEEIESRICFIEDL